MIRTKRVYVTFSSDQGLAGINVQFSASARDEQVEALMKRIEDPMGQSLAVLDEAGSLVSLDEESIVSLCADNKRLRVTADDGTYWAQSTLQAMERQLNPSKFLRISRFEIVNLDKVRRFDFSVVGELRIEMKNGMEAWGSRRYIPAIRKRLKERM